MERTILDIGVKILTLFKEMELNESILQLFQYYKEKPQEKCKIDGGVTVIIPACGKNREKIIKYCVEWLKFQNIENIEILVIEEDSSKKLEIENDSIVQYHFIHSTQLFCKAKCFNYGVLKSKYENILGLDGDFILQKDFIKEGCEELKMFDAVFLADDIYYLTDKMDSFDELNWDGRTWKNNRASWQFHGGTFMIKKSKYLQIGGFSEQFIGYGSEDTDFYSRVHASLNVSPKKGFATLHMWHVQIPENQFVKRNQKILSINMSKTVQERIKISLRKNSYMIKL